MNKEIIGMIWFPKSINMPRKSREIAMVVLPASNSVLLPKQYNKADPPAAESKFTIPIINVIAVSDTDMP